MQIDSYKHTQGEWEIMEKMKVYITKEVEIGNKQLSSCWYTSQAGGPLNNNSRLNVAVVNSWCKSNYLHPPPELSGHRPHQSHLDWKILASDDQGRFRGDYIFNIKVATTVFVIWVLVQIWPKMTLKPTLSLSTWTVSGLCCF